jgi:2-keto-4-pentenoate hydratase
MKTARNDPRILRGMETLLRMRQDRLDAGEEPIGWKAGFGAPSSMESLGIGAPLVGFLTDKVLLPSEATVSIIGWTRPAVEPEIAVHLGQDLSETGDRETTREAIASIGPAIEVAGVNFPPDDVEKILSGNVYNRHVILGRADDSRAGCVLDGLVGHIYRSGTKIATVTDPQNLTGDIVDIVHHIATLLIALGEKLRAGEVIITGSIVPPIWTSTREEFRYTLDPVDTISIHLDT